MLDKERPLGFSDRIWINHQLVEPGTYDRYHRYIDGGQCFVTLRHLNCQRETHDLNTNSVYVEHRLRYRPSLDTTIVGQTQDALQQPFYKTRRALFVYDRIAPDCYAEDTRKPTTKTNQSTQNSSGSIIIVADDLRSTGSAGFYVINCGFKETYPIEELIYVAENPRNKTVTICCLKPDATISYSTFCLPKITNAGLLPKKIIRNY